MKKPVRGIQWSGADCTMLSLAYRFTPTLEQFDLERCVESYDDRGQPAYAQPIRQMIPRSTHHGADASGPTALCSDPLQPALLWSCSRDGRIRMVRERERERESSSIVIYSPSA